MKAPVTPGSPDSTTTLEPANAPNSGMGVARETTTTLPPWQSVREGVRLEPLLAPHLLGEHRPPGGAGG